MKKIFTVLCLAVSAVAFAQVKIGGTGTPNPNAVLELDGINGKGLLLPRISKAEREAMTNVPPGMMVYQTDGLTDDNPRGLYISVIAFSNTSIWLPVSTNRNFWSAHNSNPAHTVNNNLGNIGIGTGTGGFQPTMKLDVLSSSSNVASFGSAQHLDNNVSSGIYLRQGQLLPKYTGAVKTIGTSATDARLAFFTGTETSPDALTEKLSVLSNGRVGIGTTLPNTMLEIQADGGAADMELNAQVPGGNNALLRLNRNSDGSGAAIRFKNQGVVEWDLGPIGSKNFKLAYTPNNTTIMDVDDVTRNIGFRTNDFTETVNVGGSLGAYGPVITKGFNAGIHIKDRSLNNYEGWNWFADAGKLKLFRNTTNDEAMTVNESGNVGIGSTTPTLGGLVVNGKAGAVNAMFGSNTSGVAIESLFPGIGFNSYFSGVRKAINTGFGSLVGQDPISGRFYIQTSAASVTGQGTALNTIDRLNILPNGNIGIQGNTEPQSPLSFSNTLGEKINFYDVNANANYGIGIQGAQMQLYTGSSTDAISFGHGSSTSFTEKVRMQGGYMVLNNGRIRFNGQLSAGNSSGIEFTKTGNNSALQGFIGMIDDNNLGFYGFPGAGWGLLYDVNDGAVKIGTTQKATGYKLNVGGKIIAEEVRVQLRSAWPDYIFSKNYKLRSLQDVANYININNHLPNVPAAADVEKSGIALGEMQTKMMEKIEELTLYVIELENKINKLTSMKK